MKTNEEIIPNAELMKSGKQTIELTVIWVFSNTFMLLTSVQKLLYYMKLKEQSSILANLVLNVFSQAATFSIFYLVWVFFTCMIFTVAGTTFDDGDYPGLDNKYVQFIQMFRLSTGDV